MPPRDSDFKLCKSCGATRALEDFYRNRNTKDGLSFYCKRCSKEKQRASRDKNLAVNASRLGSGEEPDKPCASCGEALPAESFYVNRARRDGRDSKCKECSAKERERRKLKPEEIPKKKTCSWCREVKRIGSFGNDRSSKDGKTIYCKPCSREKSRYQARQNKIANFAGDPKAWLEEKKCYRCKEVKPVEAYGTDRSRRDGKAPNCKSCERERQRRMKNK